ncbi:MAG: hypothetical protein JW767_03615 [Thermoleophilia bacterium]|nr:hypothetical protein [Thermoleophilia bacterium]
MATAEIEAGICGLTTTVRTKADGAVVRIEIESECEHIARLAAALTEVEPFREISFRGQEPLTLEKAREYCAHAACPVPSGILKAIEIEAGLALPKDVTIRVSKE